MSKFWVGCRVKIKSSLNVKESLWGVCGKVYKIDGNSIYAHWEYPGNSDKNMPAEKLILIGSRFSSYKAFKEWNES